MCMEQSLSHNLLSAKHLSFYCLWPLVLSHPLIIYLTKLKTTTCVMSGPFPPFFVVLMRLKWINLNHRISLMCNGHPHIPTLVADWGAQHSASHIPNSHTIMGPSFFLEKFEIIHPNYIALNFHNPGLHKSNHI